MYQIKGKRKSSFLLTLGLLVITITTQLHSQRVEFEQAVHINDNGPELNDPLLNIKLKSFNNPGILIKNEDGTAHSWLPYIDGGIYLTGDTEGSKSGNIVFRKHDGDEYSDLMKINGETGKVQVHDLEFNTSLPEYRNVFVKRNGELVSSVLGKYNVNGIDFRTNTRNAAITNYPSYAYIHHTNFDVFYSNGRQPMYASVHLPDGVAVTGITASIIDRRENANLTVQLKRIPFGGLFSEHEILAAVSSNGINNSATEKYSDGTIAHQIIDNDSYSYWVEAFPTADWDGTSYLGVEGVRIRYRH